MDIWVSGILALAGAFGGVLLSSALTRSGKKLDAKRERIETALRMTAAAIAARAFNTGIEGWPGRPQSLSDDELGKFEAKLYLDAVERYFQELEASRRAVALLATDVELGESWKTPGSFVGSVDQVYATLSAEAVRLRGNRSRRIVVD